MRVLVIEVSPHVRSGGTKHPNAFDARLAGSDAVLCISETPLLDATRALLAPGMADSDDMIVMRHAGSAVDALRARVWVAAMLTVEDRPSGQRIRLAKYRKLNAGPPKVSQRPSPVPDQPGVDKPLYGAAALPVGGGAQ